MVSLIRTVTLLSILFSRLSSRYVLTVPGGNDRGGIGLNSIDFVKKLKREHSGTVSKARDDVSQTALEERHGSGVCPERVCVKRRHRSVASSSYPSTASPPLYPYDSPSPLSLRIFPFPFPSSSPILFNLITPILPLPELCGCFQRSSHSGVIRKAAPVAVVVVDSKGVITLDTKLD